MKLRQYYKHYYCPYCGADSLRWQQKQAQSSLPSYRRKSPIQLTYDCKSCRGWSRRSTSKLSWVGSFFTFLPIAGIALSAYLNSGLWMAISFAVTFIGITLDHFVFSVLFLRFIRYDDEGRHDEWLTARADVGTEITRPAIFFAATSTMLLNFDGSTEQFAVNVRNVKVWERKIDFELAFISPPASIEEKNFVLKDHEFIVAYGRFNGF